MGGAILAASAHFNTGPVTILLSIRADGYVLRSLFLRADGVQKRLGVAELRGVLLLRIFSQGEGPRRVVRPGRPRRRRRAAAAGRGEALQDRRGKRPAPSPGWGARGGGRMLPNRSAPDLPLEALRNLFSVLVFSDLSRVPNLPPGLTLVLACPHAPTGVAPFGCSRSHDSCTRAEH